MKTEEKTGMRIKDTFVVVSSEEKSGTGKNGEWKKTEYLLLNKKEREDGSVVETNLVADASQAVGDLEVGATYDAAIFISSRSYEKEGKTLHFPSFRVTFAEKVADAPAAGERKEISVSDIGDDIPF